MELRHLILLGLESHPMVLRVFSGPALRDQAWRSGNGWGARDGIWSFMPSQCPCCCLISPILELGTLTHQVKFSPGAMAKSKPATIFLFLFAEKSLAGP